MTARKIDLMHLQFGVCEDPTATCKTCDHLVCYQANRRYYKCDIYGTSNSEASDWKVSNRACGMYNRPYSGNGIITMARQCKPPVQPISGQVNVWDLEDMYNTLNPWRK